jgi:hypothetical protein
MASSWRSPHCGRAADLKVSPTVDGRVESQRATVVCSYLASHLYGVYVSELEVSMASV